MKKLILTAGLTAAAMPAYAYVGPGMGAGGLAVLVGIVGSIILALFAVIYYPIKRVLKRGRTEQQTRQEPDPQTSTGSNSLKSTAED